MRYAHPFLNTTPPRVYMLHTHPHTPKMKVLECTILLFSDYEYGSG